MTKSVWISISNSCRSQEEIDKLKKEIEEETSKKETYVKELERIKKQLLDIRNCLYSVIRELQVSGTRTTGSMADRCPVQVNFMRNDAVDLPGLSSLHTEFIK